MTYQTLSVNLPREESAHSVLKLADRLAQRHTAHLVGMHAKPAMDMPVSIDIPVTLELTRHYMNHQRQVESRVKYVFEQITASASYVADWRSMDAWDGQRESTRAVFGALPMLRHATEVRLHRFNLPHPDRHHIVGELTEAFSLSAVGMSSLLGLYYWTYSSFALVAGATLDRGYALPKDLP